MAKNYQVRYFMFVTFLLSSISVCFLSVSFGTNSWLSSGVKNTLYLDSGGNANFGLFAGTANQIGLSGLYVTSYKIVCLNGQCMYSSAETKQARKDSLKNIQNALSNNTYYSSEPFKLLGNLRTKSFFGVLLNSFMASLEINGFKESANQRTSWTNSKFISGVKSNGTVNGDLLDEGLWLSTVVFLSLGLLFALIGSIFAVINTATTPVEAITGITGLYLWNICAAISALICIICWSVEYSKHLQDNVLVEDSAAGWSTKGLEHLGYSFWLVVASVLIHVANCVIIFIGTYEKKIKTLYEAPETKPGNIMLY